MIQSSLTRRRLSLATGNRGLKPTAKFIPTLRVESRVFSRDRLRSYKVAITQRPVNGDVIWRINYSAKDSVGRRGGDLIVDVDASDGTIKQVIRRQ